MTHTRTQPVHIRWMINRDRPEVVAISAADTADPWLEGDFLRALKDRCTIGMVAEHGETVVGFLVYELRTSHLRILNLAVAADWRRRGVGGQFVAKLITKLSSHRRTRIMVEVRESNLAGQLFLRALGFRATRVLSGRYEDGGEDAYVMRYRLKHVKVR